MISRKSSSPIVNSYKTFTYVHVYIPYLVDKMITGMQLNLETTYLILCCNLHCCNQDLKFNIIFMHFIKTSDLIEVGEHYIFDTGWWAYSVLNYHCMRMHMRPNLYILLID